MLASATNITPKVFTRALLSVSDLFRHEVQQQLVLYDGVRDWKRAGQAEEIVGLRIVAISETDEVHEGPGRLFKVALEGADGDEVTVGPTLRP